MTTYNKLAVRLERVAELLVHGKTIEEAMLGAGYGAKAAKVGMISYKRKLMPPSKHPVIAERMEELRAGARKVAQLGTVDIVQRLEAARVGAMDAGQYAAASSATMNMAKVLGLVVDRTRVEGVKPISEMTEPELEAFLEANGMALH